VELRKVFKQI